MIVVTALTKCNDALEGNGLIQCPMIINNENVFAEACKNLLHIKKKLL